MLKEYRVKNNYIIDELDLDQHDFMVRDIFVHQKVGEILVYNSQRKRVQSVAIPSGYYWNGSTVEFDFNSNEEQKQILAQKKLKEDIKRASIAYIAHTNGWIDNYDEDAINEWLSFLRSVSEGKDKRIIKPVRPNFLKDF